MSRLLPLSLLTLAALPLAAGADAFDNYTNLLLGKVPGAVEGLVEALAGERDQQARDSIITALGRLSSRGVPSLPASSATIPRTATRASPQSRALARSSVAASTVSQIRTPQRSNGSTATASNLDADA